MIFMEYKKCNEDTQVNATITQCTAFPKYQNKERWVTNNGKTNATYEITNVQRRTATDEPTLEWSARNKW